jgi:hypothetical protein
VSIGTIPGATAFSRNDEASSPGISSGSNVCVILGCDMPLIGPFIGAVEAYVVFTVIRDARSTETNTKASSFFILLSPLPFRQYKEDSDHKYEFYGNIFYDNIPKYNYHVT